MDYCASTQYPHHHNGSLLQRLARNGDEKTMQFLRFITLAVAVVLLSAHTAKAQSTPETAFMPFLGKYTGQAVFVTPTGLAKRNLEVVVRREHPGFSLEWTTISTKLSGKLKRSNYFVVFKPGKRKGYYTSTDKIDRFGSKVPIDPLAGDPQVWAKIDGKSMTVYAVLITEEGAHEVQTYERTLMAGGKMKLKFSRVRDGKPLKSIEAILNYVE